MAVVISRHPYDIAGQSTGRAWTSCKNLKVGGHRQSVFCDIEYGVLIAYLINADDVHIEKPLARLLIKPYIQTDAGTGKPTGKVVLFPDRIYGLRNPSFYATVNNWLIEKQGKYERSIYKLMANLHADTYTIKEIGDEGKEKTERWRIVSEKIITSASNALQSEFHSEKLYKSLWSGEYFRQVEWSAKNNEEDTVDLLSSYNIDLNNKNHVKQIALQMKNAGLIDVSFYSEHNYDYSDDIVFGAAYISKYNRYDISEKLQKKFFSLNREEQIKAIEMIEDYGVKIIFNEDETNFYAIMYVYGMIIIKTDFERFRQYVNLSGMKRKYLGKDVVVQWLRKLGYKIYNDYEVYIRTAPDGKREISEEAVEVIANELKKRAIKKIARNWTPELIIQSSDT